MIASIGPRTWASYSSLCAPNHSRLLLRVRARRNFRVRSVNRGAAGLMRRVCLTARGVSGLEIFGVTPCRARPYEVEKRALNPKQRKQQTLDGTP